MTSSVFFVTARAKLGGFVSGMRSLSLTTAR